MVEKKYDFDSKLSFIAKINLGLQNLTNLTLQATRESWTMG